MKKLAILCDFDGTIAHDDVGNLLFSTFADPAKTKPIVESWKRGEISSRECLEGEASHALVSFQDLNAFIAEREFDPFFKDFTDFAKRSGIEVVVVSDGLDYYIQRMLLRNGLAGTPFYSNHLQIKDGRFEVSFPHYDMLDCRDCGNCKTHHLRQLREQDYYIVYVGNGLSDRCPSHEADLVFAKTDLLAYCEKHDDINFVPFDNFRDVERELVRRFVIPDKIPSERK